MQHTLIKLKKKNIITKSFQGRLTSSDTHWSKYYPHLQNSLGTHLLLYRMHLKAL